MAGITSGAMLGFSLQTVPVLLFMTLGAIYRPRCLYGLVCFISDTSMTILTRYLTTVNGGIIFLHGDVKYALTASFLMTPDTIFGCITPGIGSRNNHKQSKKIKDEILHEIMSNPFLYLLLTIEY